jgi:hypothetical protein
MLFTKTERSFSFKRIIIVSGNKLFVEHPLIDCSGGGETPTGGRDREDPATK